LSNKVEIVEVSPVKKRSPVVVTGFTGSGFIGNSALMFIVRNKGFKLRAHLRSEQIPPMMLLIDGEPTNAFRVYGSERNDLLFVISDALVEPESTWAVGRSLMEWFKGMGVQEIYSVEGMPYAPIQEPRTLFSYGTRNKDLSQHGVVPTREGAVQGVSAVLLEESLKTDISYVTILVPTQLMSTIDYGGSAAVIDVMNSLFKLGVDATPLRKSDEMRRQMMERGRKGESRGFLSSLRRRPDSGAS